jgi:plastocyanin
MSMSVRLESIRAIASAVFLLFNLAFAAGEEAGADTQTLIVRIDNFMFSPAKISLPAGTTLTWLNADNIPHSVAATGEAFRSKLLEPGEKFSFTFVEAGTYDYFCPLHTQMRGTVIVK